MAVNSIPGINSIQPSGFMKTDKIQNNSDNEKQVSFSEYLNNALDQVNQLQTESERLGVEFAAGRTDNIHEVMIAAEKADISLQFTMQVRNKIMDAYNEIMRMQI